MELPAPAPLRANSSSGGLDEPVHPGALHLHRARGPLRRSARSPGASTASTTVAPGTAGRRDLWLLGKILDGGADAMHGELLSYVFFAGEFAEELIKLGQADAQRWIDEHPADLWQLDPLPDWSPAATCDTRRSQPRAASTSRHVRPGGATGPEPAERGPRTGHIFCAAPAARPASPEGASRRARGRVRGASWTLPRHSQLPDRARAREGCQAANLPTR